MSDFPSLATGTTVNAAPAQREPGEWSDEMIERLRNLWLEGYPTVEIGRRLGVSKNAVVGKAHRLDLPRRGSPIGKRRLAHHELEAIKRAAVAGKSAREICDDLHVPVTVEYVQSIGATARRQASMQRAPGGVDGRTELIGPTLPPLPSLAIPEPRRRKHRAAPPGEHGAVRGPGGHLRGPTLAEVGEEVAPLPPPRAATCQFPLSDGRPWRFCDSADVRPGSSYCAAHHRICWRESAPQEEAA